MLTHRYVICDVFTDRPLRGDAIAVFTRATSLSESEMRAVAREMGMSTTVFVQRPERGGHAKLRAFTPFGELSAAGNPALAAANVLGGPLQALLVHLETDRGVVDVALERDGARIVFGWYAEPLSTPLAYEASVRLLAALGISEASLPVTLYQNEASRGVLVAHTSAPEVAAIQPRRELLETLPLDSVTVFSHQRGVCAARVFLPKAGGVEAPATGSAAGLMALQLFRQAELELETVLTIEQGAETGRPSRLLAKLSRDGAGQELLLVGGAAVVVGRGELLL